VPDGETREPASAPAAVAGDGPDPITVTEASALIRRAVESTGRQRIVGEVSNFSSRQHWYFTLKDQDSQLDCVMWASATAGAACMPANGMEVVVEGVATHWGPRGRTQLVVRRISRRGAGSLQQRFEELCRVLRAEGYFDEARKRPLPPVPRAIGVVTSLHGAALQDVLRTARIRAPFVRLMVVDVPVQGDGAATAVARAVAAIDRRADELGIDAILVTRGGGSAEDLWAFNERPVADAIFSCGTPLVAAIGHESDTTVAELVADRRASTPTAAVMLLLPDREAMQQQVDHLHDRLQFLARRSVLERRKALEAIAARPVLRSARAALDLRAERLRRSEAAMRQASRWRVSAARQRLAELSGRLRAQRPAVRHRAAGQHVQSLAVRLRAAARRVVLDLRRQVDAADRQLRTLGPQETLARGWTLTFGSDGRLLRRAADARPGESMVTRLPDGEVRSRVEGQSGASLFDGA